MKNKVLALATLMAVMGISSLKAQLNVGATSAPDASAMLQVSGITKGFLPPILTTANRTALTSPAVGLVIFNSTTNQIEVNTGTTAVPIWTAGGAAAAANYWTLGGGNLYNNAGTNVGIGTTTPAFPFQVVTQGISGPVATIDRYNAGGWNIFSVRKAAGTLAAPSAVGAGLFGQFTFAPYGVGAFNPGASMKGYTTEAQTASAGGSQLRFETTPNGTVTAAEVVTIDQNGSVGIGNTAPAYKLDVTGQAVSVTNAGAAAFYRASNGTSEMRLQNNNGAGYVGSITANDFQIYSNGLPRITALSAGNVGIATAAPNSSLQVVGSTSLGYAEVTASTTLDGTYHFVNVNSASATTITLPAITSILGREYIIRNTGTGTISVVVSGGGTINAGSTSFATLTGSAGQTYTLYAGSTNWQALLNVTNISTLGAATALQSLIIPAANTATTTQAFPGAGGAVNVAFDKTGAYANSIAGADFVDATDVITLPIGTYQVIWNFAGNFNLSTVPGNVSLFWDVPDGSGSTHRVHYGSSSSASFNPYGVTFVTTMQITAATSFNFSLGSGNGEQISTYGVTNFSRLAFIKLQ